MNALDVIFQGITNNIEAPHLESCMAKQPMPESKDNVDFSDAFLPTHSHPLVAHTSSF
jgi:hypothetical protein